MRRLAGRTCLMNCFTAAGMNIYHLFVQYLFVFAGKPAAKIIGNQYSKMKKTFASVLLTLFLCPPLLAQDVDDSLRYAESIWSMEKKAMILEHMNLTEAEKSSFWPVYDSYSNAIQYLDMEYIRLLNYREEGLTEKKSASLTEHMLLNDVLLAKTRKQYYRRFKKALSPGQASRFMQLDNDFRTMIRIHAQKNSPTLVSSTRIYQNN